MNPQKIAKDFYNLAKVAKFSPNLVTLSPNNLYLTKTQNHNFGVNFGCSAFEQFDNLIAEISNHRPPPI